MNLKRHREAMLKDRELEGILLVEANSIQGYMKTGTPRQKPADISVGLSYTCSGQVVPCSFPPQSVAETRQNLQRLS